MEINFQNWFGDWKSSIELNSCCAARKDLRWYSRSENYVKRHLGIVVLRTCWRQQGELPTMSQKPFWLFWCNDSHSLSSSLLLLFERFVWPPIVLCDRKSADDKVRLYQLRNSTLGCRCSVDGRQRSQDICQRSQCTDFCNGSRYCWMSERAAGRWFSDAPHRFPLQTQPRPGKEPTTTIITFTWHAFTQPLVHCCLSVVMMLRQRLWLDDHYLEPKTVKHIIKPSRGRERNPPPPLLPSHGIRPHNF